MRPHVPVKIYYRAYKEHLVQPCAQFASTSPASHVVALHRTSLPNNAQLTITGSVHCFSIHSLDAARLTWEVLCCPCRCRGCVHHLAYPHQAVRQAGVSKGAASYSSIQSVTQKPHGKPASRQQHTHTTVTLGLISTAFTSCAQRSRYKSVKTGGAHSSDAAYQR